LLDEIRAIDLDELSDENARDLIASWQQQLGQQSACSKPPK